jgi:hypothetical protein
MVPQFLPWAAHVVGAQHDPLKQTPVAQSVPSGMLTATQVPLRASQATEAWQSAGEPHVTGVPTQAPAVQRLSVVQGSPSSQAVPSGKGVIRSQVPEAGLQRMSAQTWPAAQGISKPGMHLPP